MYDFIENNDSVFRVEEGAEKLDIHYGYNTLDFPKHFMPNS